MDATLPSTSNGVNTDVAVSGMLIPVLHFLQLLHCNFGHNDVTSRLPCAQLLKFDVIAFIPYCLKHAFITASCKENLKLIDKTPSS